MNPRDAGILHELGMLALEAGNQMEAKGIWGLWTLIGIRTKRTTAVA